MLHRLLTLIPHHLFSSFIALFGRSKIGFIRRTIIKRFNSVYDVNLVEANRDDPNDYDSFVDFFTRELKPGARIISDSPGAIVSPVDGTISEVGPITEGRLIQAKNHSYNVDDLVGQSAASLHNGWFITVYLAPPDYHRIHSPIGCELTSTTALPGRLFSVNDASADTIPNLFCRNERLVCWLSNSACSIAVVFVGAMIVSSIETVWPNGPQSPYRRIQTLNYSDTCFRAGDEMARFTLGSTVILLFPPNAADFVELKAGDRLKMGQKIGIMRPPLETQ